MAYSREEAEALLGLAEDFTESDLIKKFRGMLGDRLEPETPAPTESSLSDGDAKELAQLRREKLFTEAGIPASKEGDLLRRALANEEGLTAEKIRAEAAEYGLVSASDQAGTTVTEAETLMHQAIDSAAGEAAALPPDLVEQMEAIDLDEPGAMKKLEALENQAGIVRVGGQIQEL